MVGCGGLRYMSEYNPTVSVYVEEPPTMQLVVDRVAVVPGSSPTSGTASPVLGLAPADCRAELVQAFTQFFLSRGLRVLSADRRSDAQAILSVDVTRCDAEQTTGPPRTRDVRETFRGATRVREVVEVDKSVNGFLSAVLTVTDGETNSIVQSRALSYEPTRTITGSPEAPFPPATEVIREAYEDATAAVASMFFPTVIERELVFFAFENDRCNLNPAYEAVRRSDLDEALDISRKNLEACRPDPDRGITSNDLVAARYNVGVIHRMREEFDAAEESFVEALSYGLTFGADGNVPLIRRAFSEAREAAALALEGSADAAARAQQTADAADEILTNGDIIALAGDGLADDVIIEIIETSEVDFDVSREALGILTQEGLSPAVIAAMVRAARAPVTNGGALSR